MLRVGYHGAGDSLLPFGFYVEGDHKVPYKLEGCAAAANDLFDLFTSGGRIFYSGGLRRSRHALPSPPTT